MKQVRKDILDILRRAQEAFMAQNYTKALEDYHHIEKELADSPKNLPAIWIEIGWNYYLLKEFSKAGPYFEMALGSPHINQKQVFDCLRLTGFCYEFTDQPDKALAFLQDALGQPLEEREKRYVLFEIGKIFYTQNLTKEARPYLEKAIEHFSEDEAAYLRANRYYLGFILFYEKENREAEKLFERIITDATTDSDKASGYFGIAHLLYEKRDFEELITCCKTITRLDSDFFDMETLAFFLCRSYLELEMWTELEVFLPNMIEHYAVGRYSVAYPQLQESLKQRKNLLVNDTGDESSTEPSDPLLLN
ncbi:MAG: tetratricopeptide repeat protein [Calditrichia bacterium]